MTAQSIEQVNGKNVVKNYLNGPLTIVPKGR